MSINNKTLQVFWVGLGSLSSIALGFLSTIVLSRYLDKDELGTFRQISFVYTTLAIFFTAGLPAVYAYYLPRFSAENGISIIKKIQFALLVLGAIFSVTLYFAAPLIAVILKNPDLLQALRIFSIAPTFIIPSMGVEAILAANGKSGLIAIYTVTTKTLSLACILIPVMVFDGNYIFAIYGWVAASALSILVALQFERIPYRGIPAVRCGLTYKEVLQYSIPLGVAGIWGVGMRSADQFYISRYFGPGEYAEYSLGMIELPFVGMITAATSTVLMPIFSEMIHQDRSPKEILDIWTSALMKSASLIYPMAVFGIVFSNEIMSAMYTEKFASAARYFSIALSMNFFNIIIFSPLILSMGRVKVYSCAHIVAFFVTWGLGFISASIFGSALGVAVSAVAVKIAIAVFFLWYVSRKFNVGFGEVFPVLRLTVMASFMALIAVACKYLVLHTGHSGDIQYVFFALLIFSGTLLVSARLIGVNYLQIAGPVILAARQKIRGMLV